MGGPVRAPNAPVHSHATHNPPLLHAPPHHQVATDALTAMEKAMARDGIKVNDRQLACARISSPEGQDYLAAMACAANYAWVNRSSMTFLARAAFSRVFGRPADELDMHVVYDVSHNIAKARGSVVWGGCGRWRVGH